MVTRGDIASDKSDTADDRDCSDSGYAYYRDIVVRSTSDSDTHLVIHLRLSTKIILPEDS